MSKFNRRTLLKSAAAIAATGSLQIREARAESPNEKVNLAIIGCTNQGGGIGAGAIRTGKVNVVAFCDVEPSRTNRFKSEHPEAKVFSDFREMFDKMGGQIDACTIGVPDHAHFPIAMRAMANGTSIYVEKPLAQTFEECKLMMAAESKYQVACQMGNQGHSGEQRMQFKTWVESGIIKNVRRVDACMNKGRRWHPWGNVTGFPPADPMPEGMNWEAWTGTRPMHDYSRKFDPGNWRGWYEYGNGAFGDWGPHTLDTVHRFLKLGLPYEIRADKLEGQNDFIYPMASTIAFEFAARGDGMPAVTVNWYDGVKNRPPRPEALDEIRNVPECGKVIYSDDLTFMGGTHSSRLAIIPEEKMQDMQGQFPDIPHGETSQNHMENFINAVKGEEECNSKFAVSGVLTQVFMLGCIAQRLGGTLEFDTATEQITNNERANQLLQGPPPREGWEEFYRI